MSIGRMGARGSTRAMIPLLARAPDLPYVFAPPAFDDGAIEEWAIVWMTLQAIEMIIRGWLLQIG